MRPPQLISVEVSHEGKPYDSTDAIESSVTRLQMFRNYMDDWDGQGASAANTKAIDEAIKFLTLLEVWHPSPLATLSRSGDPILEFDDVDSRLFSSITFLPDGVVELYTKNKDAENSDFLSGPSSSPAVQMFISSVMNLPTMM
jgi:hypothetical protein